LSERASELILNGTSAQIQGHSHQYTLENTGQKTNQKQILLKLNTTQKKSKRHKTQQNKTSLV